MNDDDKTYPCTGEYEGRPTISLGPYFHFGVPKAMLILANIDAIRAFVAAHPLPARRVRRG